MNWVLTVIVNDDVYLGLLRHTGAWYCQRKKYTSVQYRKQESCFEGQYCIVRLFVQVDLGFIFLDMFFMFKIYVN